MSRTGRRPGVPDTRDAIVAVARRRFATRGYDATSLRSIATEAKVDPALLIHYFGSKDQLFVAATGLPAGLSELFGSWPPSLPRLRPGPGARLPAARGQRLQPQCHPRPGPLRGLQRQSRRHAARVPDRRAAHRHRPAHPPPGCPPPGGTDRGPAPSASRRSATSSGSIRSPGRARTTSPRWWRQSSSSTCGSYRSR